MSLSERTRFDQIVASLLVVGGYENAIAYLLREAEARESLARAWRSFDKHVRADLLMWEAEGLRWHAAVLRDRADAAADEEWG